MNTLEYIFPKAYAIDKVRTTLITNGIDIVEEKDINKGLGLKFTCFKVEKIMLVLYFKGAMSSKIVFEKVSDEVIKYFDEIQQSEPSSEIQQSSVPIHANIKIEKPELQGAIKEKINELFGDVNFEQPKETIFYKTTITKSGVRFTLTQYKNGTLLLQGTSSQLFEEIKQIINDINPITDQENALLFVPREGKNAVEKAISETPEAFWDLEEKAKRRISPEAYAFLYKNDQNTLMSAIGIFEAIRQANLKIPLYNPVLYPFSKVFEGFMIKLLINKEFFTFDEYKNDTRVARIGNVLKEKKFNKYIRDIYRNENVLEQLKIAWEVLRCDELHSDPAQNTNISDLDDIQQVDNLIGSISDAILKGYRIIVANGYTEEEMLANKKSESTLQSSTIRNAPKLKEIPTFNSHIGTDESGKGDYFGPLVVAGVFINKELESKLLSMGVRDSKKNSDNKNHEFAEKIKLLLGNNNYSIVFIGPEKYNELYSKLNNLNILLAWGHARSIENILNKIPCNHAISDQFGDEKYIKDALMKNGKNIELIQTPKGERDIAVAAASILARDMYLNQLQLLSNKCKVDLPKGANQLVEERAKMIVSMYGKQSLTNYAKMHFKTTEKVIK